MRLTEIVPGRGLPFLAFLLILKRELTNLGIFVDFKIDKNAKKGSPRPGTISVRRTVHCTVVNSTYTGCSFLRGFLVIKTFPGFASFA